MAKSELQKLSRAELLEMLVEQTEKADKLQQELDDVKRRLSKRESMLAQALGFAETAIGLVKKTETVPITLNLLHQGQKIKIQGDLTLRKRIQKKTGLP